MAEKNGFNITNSPGEVLAYKSDGSARRKFLRTPLKGTRILCYGRVPNLFPLLRGTNSTATNYITGAANFNSKKDNFPTVSSQGLFEKIVTHFYPNQSFKVLAPSPVPIHKFNP